jgi:hypothetical protein
LSARCATTPSAPKDKAFTLMAELFLMQHTCHWYCKSKPVASARLMARHQTGYAQVIDAVDPATRRAYLAGQRLRGMARLPATLAGRATHQRRRAAPRNHDRPYPAAAAEQALRCAHPVQP